MEDAWSQWAFYEGLCLVNGAEGIRPWACVLMKAAAVNTKENSCKV